MQRAPRATDGTPSKLIKKYTRDTLKLGRKNLFCGIRNIIRATRTLTNNLIIVGVRCILFVKSNLCNTHF